MTPAEMLTLVTALTAGASAAEWVRRRRSRRALRELAAQWRMNFGPADTLRLTPKVARHFPVPGAAHLRVTHVIYGTDADRYRYVFTAEFTVGVVRTKRRLVRVGAFSEPRDRERGLPPSPVVLAPDEVPLIEQYRYLAPEQSERPATAAGNPPNQGA